MKKLSLETDKLNTPSFDVVGIGSPLLDIFIPPSKNIFQNQKGSISQANRFLTQNDLEKLSKQTNEPITCSAAGSAVNTLMALDILGFRTSLIGQIGNDGNGKRLIEDLSLYNIDTEGVNVSQAHSSKTGLCFVTMEENGERSMNTYLGNSLNIEFSKQMEGIIKKAKFIYLEGYLWNSLEGIAFCKRIGQFCRENRIRLVFNLSDIKIITQGGHPFKSFVENYVNITFGNIQEYRAFFNKDEFDIKQEWFGKDFDIACITKDKDGSLIFSRDLTYEIPAIPTECINSTGAGDLYVSGFLGGLLRGYDITMAGAFAGRVASEFISSHPNTKNVAMHKLSRFKDQLNKKTNQEEKCQNYAFVA